VGERPIPTAAVAELTATEAFELFKPFLDNPPAADDPFWGALALLLNEGRLKGIAAQLIARRDADEIADIVRAIKAIDKVLARIESNNTTVDCKDWRTWRADGPGVTWLLDGARHYQLSRERDRLANFLLPLMDPRRAPNGGHSQTTVWEAVAHLVWLIAETLLPVKVRSDAPFIQFVVVAVNRLLGFTDSDELNEEALVKWAQRHEVILSRTKPGETCP
jgi:hypothetical protein